MSQELRVNFTGDSKNLNRATKNAEKTLGGFDKTLTNVGKTLAGVFATRELVNFGKEAVLLAARIEGVERAFSTLDGVTLSGLRSATKGTVTDMRLMQAAVQARNFKIPLEQLGGFFEFATKRASETGESVDYLVNSIITGIGRKSPLILDNLGISAVALREKLKGVGLESATTTDIARVMNEIIAEQNAEFGDLGDSILTTQQKIDRMSVSWDRFKTSFGQTVIDTGIVDFLSGLFESASKTAEMNSLIKELGLDTFKAKKEFAELSGELGSGALATQAMIDKLTKMKLEREKNSKAMMQVVNEQREALGLTDKTKGSTEGLIQATAEFTKIMDSFNKKMAVYNAEWSLFGENDIEGKINSVKAAMTALSVEGSQQAIDKIRQLRGELELLQARAKTAAQGEAAGTATQRPNQIFPQVNIPTLPNDLSAPVETMTEKFSNFDLMAQELGVSMENLGMQFSQVFTGMLENGTMTFKSLVVALVRLITKMIAALAIGTALKSLLNPAAGSQAMATVVSVSNSLGSLLAGGIPAFANGGYVSSPTLAMVGEGSQSEYILPENKLRAMMDGAGGGMNGQVILRGQDLILAYDRARRVNTRVTG